MKVIGMARGDASRISDYYTRDRSTPLRDGQWDGEDDITAAIGWDRDGETVIIFRKKLTASGPTDHSITNENINELRKRRGATAIDAPRLAWPQSAVDIAAARIGRV